MPNETDNPRKGILGQRLAKWSWISFLLFFGLNFVGRATGYLVPAEVTGLLVLLVGVGLGVSALFFVPSQGRRGVLIPALLGIVLNGAFVVVWTTNFLTTLLRVNAGR